MSDTIYRQEAIDAIYEHEFSNWCDKDEVSTVLNDLPSADRPQAEWIPCSERLPSEQGHYLVTFPLCNGEPWVYILSFNKGKFYETDDEWGDVEYDDVTAWMPLPQPWKGVDDEQHND